MKREGGMICVNVKPREMHGGPNKSVVTRANCTMDESFPL